MRPEVAVGMTPAEAEVWEKVGIAAGSYLRLTESEPHHGMEREEVCHAFHVIQGWLLGRPMIRKLEEAHRPAWDVDTAAPHAFVGGDVHGRCGVCLAPFEDPRHDDFDPITEEPTP